MECASLQQYLVRRLSIAVLTVFGAAFVTFAAVHLLPGSTVDVLLQSGGYADVKTRQQLAHALGIDRPLLVQFASWIFGVIQGDFGHSLITKRPIGPIILGALPVTLELGALSVIFSSLIGVPIGVFSAVKQNTTIDYLARSMSVFFLSVPGFFLGVVIITFGSRWFNWTPPLQYIPIRDNVLRNLEQFSVPALVLGLGSSAGLMRFSRTAVLEVVRQDYIRTAQAKGLRQIVVINRHVLRNSMLPVITILGIYLAYVVGGEIIFEQLFQLPGLGRYLLTAIAKRDYPGVEAVGLVFAVFVVLINLATDLVYGWADPRIRFD
jgi:peptide/nickel transport system permease protein